MARIKYTKPDPDAVLRRMPPELRGPVADGGDPEAHYQAQRQWLVSEGLSNLEALRLRRRMR